MALYSTMQNFSLIFQNKIYEDEFQDRERKGINSFAFYSAYTIMIGDLGMTIFVTVTDMSSSSPELKQNSNHLVMMCSIIFTLMFESLTFYVKQISKARGFFLIICLYLILCMDLVNESIGSMLAVM